MGKAADSSVPRSDAKTPLAELGAFVRRCRERLNPEDLHLTTAGRRRTPGLRREELSHAAGVGLTWLTWLEQGRQINVSTDVLTAIAKALRLSDDENAYLFALAGLPIPKIVVHAGDVPERILTLVDGIHYPACILNYRLEVAHLNSLGVRFFLYGADADRNCARRVFFDERYRALFEDVDALEKLAVGILRLGWSRHPSDAQLDALITELGDKSARFRTLWSEGHVMHPVEQGVVGFQHPQFGRVPYEAQTLLLNENADVSVYVAVPVENDAFDSIARNGAVSHAARSCETIKRQPK